MPSINEIAKDAARSFCVLTRQEESTQERLELIIKSALIQARWSDGGTPSCPDCFGGVVPVFHGDTTGEKPCPQCNGSTWAERAAREIALWVCQRDDNRTEHDASAYASIIFRHAPRDGERLALLEWLGESAFFPDWDDNGFWHAKINGQRVIGTTLRQFCDAAIAAKNAEPSTQ